MTPKVCPQNFLCNGQPINYTQHSGFQVQFLSVATPAEPRGEKKAFFVQILGGEKLLKFVEKCR